MSKLILLLVFLISHFTYAQSTKASTDFFGSKNQEAQFSFETPILIATSKGTPTNDMIQSEFKLYSKYILGQMRRTLNNAAAVYPKFTATINKIEKSSDSFNKVYVQFTARGVFTPDLNEYTFYIPQYTGQIFQKSKNRCTEESNVDEGNFWYHWDPKISGCPLIAGTDYTVITAPLNYIPSTTSTYPEYDRLVRNGGLRMTIFFGLENYDETDWNPITNTTDWGAIGYSQKKDVLIRLGFESTVWTESEVRKWYNPASGKPIPHLENFTKQTRNGPMTIRMFLGSTGLEHDAGGFHIFLKDSLWNDSSMIYNGHSGIGKNLDISKIAAVSGYKLPISNDYQVFFLGSCVPYSYYTDMFFEKKSSATDITGTKGLDIIAYGNESQFASNHDTNLIKALLKYMERNKRTTYQKIVTDSAEFFLGVNGDEDNPTN